MSACGKGHLIFITKTYLNSFKSKPLSPRQRSIRQKIPYRRPVNVSLFLGVEVNVPIFLIIWVWGSIRAFLGFLHKSRTVIVIGTIQR